MHPPTLEPVADSRVLVVDDDAASRELVQRILVRESLTHVTLLADPSLAGSVLEDVQPNLVVLDLHMPDVDGFQVLRTIRKHAAATFLPVIVVTVDDSGEALQRALSMGAHDYVVKPFNAVELALRVRNLLLQERAYAELSRNRAQLRSRLDLFEPDLAGGTANPDEVRAIMIDTIEADRVTIVVQPVVDMRDGRPLGGEALARFPDTVIGPTAAWFAAALELGLLEELERAALRCAARVIDSIGAGLRLSINLSPSTLVAGLPPDVVSGIDWTRVVIELTEHVPVVDYEALNAALAPLREAGAWVAIDDTGAGFASLSHIMNIRPDVIKVDIGIIRGIDADPVRAAVVAMLVEFSEGLGLTLVAEGVSTEAERRALLDLGVFEGQGFLLGRPGPVVTD